MVKLTCGGCLKIRRKTRKKLVKISLLLDFKEMNICQVFHCYLSYLYMGSIPNSVWSFYSIWCVISIVLNYFIQFLDLFYKKNVLSLFFSQLFSHCYYAYFFTHVSLFISCFDVLCHGIYTFEYNLHLEFFSWLYQNPNYLKLSLNIVKI